MKKIIICFVLFCVPFITALDAKGTESEDYIIEKGDTLWDISDTRLEDPFLWPKLWSVNPDINDPDLIYPGAAIYIPSREELMRMPDMGIPGSPASGPKKASDPKKTVKKRLPFSYRPKVTTKKQEERFIFISPKKKVQKYIVDKNLYIWSGWISEENQSVSKKTRGIGEVSHAPMESMISGKGDIVYVKMDSGTEPYALDISDTAALAIDKKKGGADQFLVFKDIKLVRHPETNRKIGHQIRVAGILEVIGVENKLVKTRVIESFEDIHHGDGLLPYVEMEPPLFPKEERTPQFSGYIIETHLNDKLTGEGNVIFIDKGENSGVQLGDIFSVFAEFPSDRILGKIQVISLQPSTAGAVIIEMKEEIMLGAKWGNK